MKPSCSISRDDGFVAQYIWIALSGPGQGDELIGDGPPNMVVVVPSAQGNAGHLESYTQSTPGLQVEIIRAFEIGRDWHGCAPLVACQAGAQSVSRRRCLHAPPDGSVSALVGRHGAMNPARKVRYNMWTK